MLVALALAKPTVSKQLEALTATGQNHTLLSCFTLHQLKGCQILYRILGCNAPHLLITALKLFPYFLKNSCLMPVQTKMCLPKHDESLKIRSFNTRGYVPAAFLPVNTASFE